MIYNLKTLFFRRKLLVVRDGVAVHRSREVKAFPAENRGRIVTAQLPAYAPDLNPA